MERVKSFFREENKTAKFFAVLTILSLFVVGNATGVFAAFYRTLNNINVTGVDTPNLYGYGYGYDNGGTNDYGYGYGYGYGFNGTCTPIANASTYDTSCAVATCSTGYSVSANSCIADTVVTPAVVNNSGGGGSSYTPTTTVTPATTVAPTTVTADKNGIVVTTTNKEGITTTTKFVRPGVIIKSLKEIKFTDLNNNWAKNYIDHLVARGIVNNTEKYNPDNNLTRAEFLKIAMNAAGWKATATGATIFKDVAADAWYAPYVSLALSKSIVSNKNTSFRPNDSISRAEAAKIIVGIFGANVANTTKASFADVDATSDLSKYIETAKSLGFFSGQAIVSGPAVSGKLMFRPNDSITRAEIAKVVVSAFKL